MAEEESESAESSGKTSILKGWAAVIASVAALVTAIGALLKTPKEPAAEAAYETLSAAVKNNSEQSAKNHDDVENLRNYLEGYIRGNGHTPPAPTVDAGPAVAANDPNRRNSRPSAPAPVGTRSGGGSQVDTSQVELPPAPPPIGPRPTVWHPPDFGKMKK